jgi:hypothetical protein
VRKEQVAAFIEVQRDDVDRATEAAARKILAVMSYD